MAIRWKPGIRIDLDPNAHKNYTFDFADFIPEGVTMSGYAIVHGEQITVDDDTSEGAEVTFWVSGITDGVTETVTVRVTLSTGLIDDFSLRFRGRQQ
jgi:hypothetical protein